jgi:hypothetical protein
MRLIDRYKNPKIECNENIKSLNEIYSSGFQFCMTDGTFKQLTPWFLCKDYFNDFVWASINAKDAGIYGYQTDIKNLKLNPKEALLTVRNKQRDDQSVFFKEIRSSILLINKIFKKIISSDFCVSIKGVKTEKTKEGKDFIIVAINIPEIIFSAGAVLSLFGLLIRCGNGFDHKKDPIEYLKNIADVKNLQKNDALYIKESVNTIENMYNNSFSAHFTTNIEENWNKELQVNTVHNSLGIVSYSNYLKSNPDKKYIDMISNHIPKKTNG